MNNEILSLSKGITLLSSSDFDGLYQRSKRLTCRHLTHISLGFQIKLECYVHVGRLRIAVHHRKYWAFAMVMDVTADRATRYFACVLLQERVNGLDSRVCHLCSPACVVEESETVRKSDT